MKSHKLLFLDDEENVLKTLKRLFMDVDIYEIHTVLSAKEALQLLDEHTFSLVLSDYRMPDMDGVELFRQIRVVKPDLPVTIITGYPDSDLMMSALAHGPLGVMSKPFSSSDILTAAHNYLRFGREPG